jgi:thiamine-phosphate pyrophosphorylase
LKNLNDIDFYFITDANLSKKGIFSDVEDAVHAGCSIVQYREKGMNDEDMIEEARQIKELCGNKAFFLVNDRVDIALAADADGVHLGQGDLDVKTARRILGKKILGVTVHNLEEARNAANEGADYLGVGPIFSTNTKPDAGRPCGTALIEQIKDVIDLPIVAIGGITKQNTPPVIRAGANSVAAVSAVVCSDDVEREVKYFIQIIRESK